MKKTLLTAVLSVFLAGISGAAEAADTARITVEITAGEHYTHRKWFGPIPVKLTPTMAVWVEDENGRFAGTVFVTRKAAEKKWTGGKNIERPEALPVYFHRLRAAAEKPDSVSGATPKATGEILLDADVPLGAGTWRVFAEINASFDYNEAYPKDSTGVNGQPSVVYFGTLVSGEKPAGTILRPLGTGDAGGRSGAVSPDLRGLTTALGIIDEIAVRLRD